MAITQHNLNEISLRELLPTVNTEVFTDHADADFYVGKVAMNGSGVSMPNEFLALRQLRANIYIDQMGFLGPDMREVDGGESDVDDHRSAHFAVIENHKDLNQQRLVGGSRLIIKRDKDDRLPIENFFPEIFDNDPAQAGSVEASRFIARHPDKITQHMISFAGIRAMDMQALELQSPYVYAVIEKPLAKLFKLIQLPFEQLSAPKPLNEYSGTQNMAIRIDPKEVLYSAQHETGKQVLSDFFKNAVESLGLGYYDKSLM